jgi:hypothetical protein
MRLFKFIALSFILLGFSANAEDPSGIASIRSVDRNGSVRQSSQEFVWKLRSGDKVPCAKLQFEANGRMVNLCLKERLTVYPPEGKDPQLVKFHYIIELPEYHKPVQKPVQEIVLNEPKKNTLATDASPQAKSLKNYRFDIFSGYASVTHQNTFPLGGNTEALFQGKQLEIYASAATITPVLFELLLEGELRFSALGGLNSIVLGSAYLEKNYLISKDKVFCLGLGGSGITMSGSSLYGIRNVGGYAVHLSVFPVNRHWSFDVTLSPLLRFAPSFMNAWLNITTKYTLPCFKDRFSLAIDLNWIGLNTLYSSGASVLNYKEHSYALLLGYNFGE